MSVGNLTSELLSSLGRCISVVFWSINICVTSFFKPWKIYIYLLIGYDIAGYLHAGFIKNFENFVFLGYRTSTKQHFMGWDKGIFHGWNQQFFQDLAVSTTLSRYFTQCKAAFPEWVEGTIYARKLQDPILGELKSSPMNPMATWPRTDLPAACWPPKSWCIGAWLRLEPFEGGVFWFFGWEMGGYKVVPPQL